MQRFVAVQGLSVPALGFGTWPLGGAQCQRAVEHALELGYRHIDTAQGYDNEEAVGAAVRVSGISRDQISITTKVNTSEMSDERVRSSTARSLERLDCGPVDLLLIHWPSSSVPLAETLGAMNDLRERGSVRSLGVSNFGPDLLAQALTIAPIVCDQVECHPYRQQRQLKQLCRERDVLFVAYSPVAKGRVSSDSVLQDIARRHGKTPAQVALRWLIDQDHVSAIPNSSSAHIRENFEIWDFELDADDVRRIDALG